MQPVNKNLPFLGALNVEILQASQTSLPGDLYFDLMVRESGDAEGVPFQIRVSRGACQLAPMPGTHVKASFLAGQVESITPAG